MNRPIALLICAAALTACGQKSGFGFRLPDGDAARGRQAFADLRCNACHTIEGLDLPLTGTGVASVRLGGATTRVRTYGELVTAIINPSHKLARGYEPAAVSHAGESLMAYTYLDEQMTVRQLIDLVAFLETTYRVTPPDVQPYLYVYP